MRWGRHRDLNTLVTALCLTDADVSPAVRLRTRIEAHPEANARPESKSSIRGLGEFPPHTDGAHLAAPPRYVLLRSKSIASGAASTLLSKTSLRMSSELEYGLRNGIWAAGRRRNARLWPVLAHGAIRWDEDCMRPADLTARIAHAELALIASKSPKSRHCWSDPDEVLVIDNWRTLHGREAVKNEERILERLAVR